MKANDEEGYQWLLRTTASPWPSSLRGGGGTRRGEKWRGAEARMEPDPQGCWTGPPTASSTAVLDGQLAGDLHREELDRFVDGELTEGLHRGDLDGPWMGSSSGMTSTEDEQAKHVRWDGERGVGDARGAGRCEGGGGAAEVVTHGAKATPSSQAYDDGLSRSATGGWCCHSFFNCKQT
jgi:hypothetical protein